MISSQSPKQDATRQASRAQQDTAGEFGHRLRGWRNSQGLTLRLVSEASGISITYLSDLERGKLANPTLDTLTALAEALGVSLNQLLGLEDEVQTPRYSEALEKFRASSAFREALEAEAERWRANVEELEQSWLQSLAAIRIGKRAPRSASDYQFVFEAVRRVLE